MVTPGWGIRKAFLRKEEVASDLNLGPGWVLACSMGRRAGGSQPWEEDRPRSLNAWYANSYGLGGHNSTLGSRGRRG